MERGRRALPRLRRRALGAALAAAALAACAGGPGAGEGAEAPAHYLRATDGAQCGLDAAARPRA